MPQARIFVSYSHQNQRPLKQFQRFVTPLERDGLVSYWDDTRLSGGDDWYAEIDRALQAASIAVLFISQDFIASPFIWREELPRVLAREDAGQLKIVPVFLSPATVDEECSYRDQHGALRRRRLAALQGYGTPQKPLSDLTWADREREYEKVYARLRQLALGESAAAGDAALPAAARVPLRPLPPAAETRSYTLTVHLARRDGQLDLRYTLPGSDVIDTATLAWATLTSPPEEIARALDQADEATLPGLLRERSATWGALLGELLLGPAGRCARLLRIVFERPPPAAQPNPTLFPVRLRICTSDPLLLGLPWRLSRWQGSLLVDSGWEFSTSSVVDPGEYPVVPAPAGVLIIAPRSAGQGPASDPAQVEAIVDALRQAWPSPRRAETLPSCTLGANWKTRCAARVAIWSTFMAR